MPFLQFGIELLQIVNPPFSKALLGQRRQLDFRNIKPVSMLWRIMKLKSLCKPNGFSWLKSFIEGTLVVRI